MKMESKMPVAERQKKGKAHENGTKENLWTGVRTSGETAFQARPIFIGRRQKHIKRES